MTVMHLTGTSFFQNAIRKSKEGDSIILVAEPMNAFDKNAIGVINSRTNEKIGFVSKKYNADVVKKLAYKTHTAKIKNIVGTDILGVVLEVTWGYIGEGTPSNV